MFTKAHFEIFLLFLLLFRQYDSELEILTYYFVFSNVRFSGLWLINATQYSPSIQRLLFKAMASSALGIHTAADSMTSRTEVWTGLGVWRKM